MIFDLLFYINLALLITHELDAIQCHEWRMFPFIWRLNDESAYRVFILLHVPLLALIFWLISRPDVHLNFWFQVSLDVFFMLHFCLHKLLQNHDKNGFTTSFSRAIIFLVAFFGLIHLVALIVR